MILAQNDPDKTRSLAAALLDHHAKAIAGGPNSSAGIAQISPDSYRDALTRLRNQFPTLARAADDGYITATDWQLLATLLPSTATEIKNRFGIEPLNLQGSNYAATHGARRYDNHGNEFPTYVR